jgi:hypothetical protein
MTNEGFAGPKTARVVILLATFDALRKLIQSSQVSDFSSITSTDLLMITLCYIMFKDNIEREA